MELGDRPAVSVIIPAFNAERFLAATLDSVLAQTWADLECIVVDDGSTDGTASVVEGCGDVRVRLVSQPNGGVSNARNRGLIEARGEYVAFLDADDIWLPRKLETQLTLFGGNPRLGLVLSGYNVVSESLRNRFTVIPDRRQLDLRRLLMLEASGIGLSFTGVARTDVARAVRFDETLSTSADLAFALGVREGHSIDAVVDSLALYRVHGEQMHLNLPAFERDMLQLFDRWLQPGSALARHRRRAVANLYTRLFYYETSRGKPRKAGRALWKALTQRPDRIVMLPIWAATTRLRRRAALRRVERRTAPS